MSNITREYALELANLYGIEVNKDSKEHLVEDENGYITEFQRKDIHELFGIDIDSDSGINWYDIEDGQFNYDHVNEHSISIKFNLEDNISQFTAEEVKGVA